MIQNKISFRGRVAHIFQFNSNSQKQVFPPRRSLEIDSFMFSKISDDDVDLILSVITIKKTIVVIVYKNRECTVYDTYKLEYKNYISREFMIDCHKSILKKLDKQTIPTLEWTTHRSQIKGGSMSLMTPSVFIPNATLCVQKVLRETEKAHVSEIEKVFFPKK